ncbi:MAG: hypothetical protein ACP5VP_12140 [Candidatus Limnocylindrales bacterium]
MRGILEVPRSRARADRRFLRGLPVWILVTQVFVFCGSQLGGLGGLDVDLLARSRLRPALASESMTGEDR